MKIHHSLYLPKWNSFFTFFFYFWKKKISWILLSCMNFQNTERIFHSVKENISSSYTTEKKSEECIHEYQISQRIRKESIGVISFSSMTKSQEIVTFNYLVSTTSFYIFLRIFCTILDIFYVPIHHKWTYQQQTKTTHRGDKRSQCNLRQILSMDRHVHLYNICHK